MNLFDQILNQAKLGTPGQFSGGTSFGSINTQDFQSKAPAIQKSVQAGQNLVNKGFSEKEVKFLKLQKEKGVDMNQAFDFIEKKRQEAKGFGSDANRSGFLQQAGGVGADIIGGAVSEVPSFLGNTASFMSKAGAYTPMSMVSAGIRAPFSEKTYGQLREEQKQARQVFADVGQRGKELVQSTGLYDPTTTSAKVGEFGTQIAGSIIGPNKVGILKKGAQALGAGKKLATGAKIGDIALEGGLAGAKFDVGTKGEITPQSVAFGAIGNVGVAGVLKGGKSLASRYTGANISTRANRFTAYDEEKFIKMTGETPGQFATSRGMNAVGEDAVKQSSQLYKKSMDKADEALSKIEGSFSTKGQTDDIIGDILEGNMTKIKAQPRNPDATRVKELYSKYENGQGLSMSEINEVKRIFARNHKFTWDQRASDSAVNATNLQNDLRKWQMKLAEESGLENLYDINKTTQAWKAFADNLEKRLDRSGANNLVSLSDWVALSGGNPTNIALFAGKKAFELPWVKQGAIKLFSKQTKPSIIEPTTENIIKTNLQRKYANPSVSGDMSSISNKSLVKPAGLLPAPSKKVIQRKENVELSKKLIKEQQAKESVTKQSDITGRSIVMRPLSLAEKNQIAELKSLEKEISKADSFEKAKLREDFASKIKGIKNKMLESSYRKILMKEESRLARNYLREESPYGNDLVRSFRKLKALGDNLKKGPKDLIESRKGKTYQDFTDSAQSYINKISGDSYSNLTPDDIFEEMSRMGPLGTSRKTPTPKSLTTQGKIKKVITPQSPVAGERGYTTAIKKPIVKRASDVDSGLIEEARKLRKSDEELIKLHTSKDYIGDYKGGKEIDTMKALQKLPDYIGTVYEGIGRNIEGVSVGDTIPVKSIKSASEKLSVAKEWSTGSWKQIFKINTKNGKNISGYSNYPNEAEVALAGKGHYKITGIKNQGGYEIIEVDYIPEIKNLKQIYEQAHKKPLIKPSK